MAVLSLHQNIPESIKEGSNLTDEKIIVNTLKKLEGPIFQKPPAISAVSKKLRIRKIFKTKLYEYDEENRLAVFWSSVQSGSYIRTLCVHTGLLLGVESSMAELRRVRSGIMDETKYLYTMHDILDA